MTPFAGSFRTESGLALSSCRRGSCLHGRREAAELGAGALGVELDTMKPANRLPVETRPLWADPISDAPLDRLALG